MGVNDLLDRYYSDEYCFVVCKGEGQCALNGPLILGVWSLHTNTLVYEHTHPHTHIHRESGMLCEA